MQTNNNLIKLKWKLTPEKRKEIVERYCNGEKPTFIARQVEVDHSTVYYYLKKANVFSSKTHVTRVTKKVITIVENDTENITTQKTTVSIEEEPVCAGHDYAYYLQIEKERRLKKHHVL